MAAPTCCIDTSKSRSGSAEFAVHRVLLAASKHKRNSGSDETKRKNCEEKTRLVARGRHDCRDCTRSPIDHRHEKRSGFQAAGRPDSQPIQDQLGSPSQGPCIASLKVS